LTLQILNLTNITQPLVTNTTVEGTCVDLSGELATIPTGQAALVDLTDNLLLYPFAFKLTEDLQTCMYNANMIRLDSIGSNGIEGNTIANDSVFINTENGDQIYTGINSAGASVFDSDRPILREPTVGTVIGKQNVTDWLEWWYFTPPTIEIVKDPAVNVIEIGSILNFNLITTTTNAGGATLDNGTLVLVGGDTLSQYGDSLIDTFSFTYTPLQTPTDTFENTIYNFRATQEWTNGDDSGVAQSSVNTLKAVYPVFYGMVADTATAFSTPYLTLNKLIEEEGDKEISFTGTGLIIYGFPRSWQDEVLSGIFDANDFNTTGSFARVDNVLVSSVGLPNEYVDVPYVFYYLNTGTTTTFNTKYTFRQ